jgi:hypothetical protein
MLMLETKPKRKRETRGGQRQGAGRKATGDAQVMLWARVPQSIYDAAHTKAQALGMKTSEYVRAVLRADLGDTTGKTE